ncbi:MAG: stage II sporulation protein D [Oscillospiraceae bacterium]|nr:stage II sporulation protein D [Oscillospiraceae bacterium]
MKRTILYAYIALLIAVGLPFLANLGERDAHAAPYGCGEANPTPLPAVDEAPLPSVSPAAPTEAAPPPAPETISVLKKDGSVEEMDMQAYLRGVVSAEMPPGFHPEALKAQAVAARSYAMYCASFAKHGAAQVCTDYACCQAWQSEEECKAKWGERYDENAEKIRAAVEGTRGEYLASGGSAVFAAFHSSSAGATENSADVWSAVPYLVSVESPETAEDVPNYISVVQCSPIDFRDTLLSAHPEADFSGAEEEWVGDMRHDASGRVASVVLGGVDLEGKELRKLFSLRSTAFELAYDAGVFTFTVTGFGHGVGMSQYGADKMARQGADYTEILSHYYPGTVLVK